MIIPLGISQQLPCGSRDRLFCLSGNSAKPPLSANVNCPSAGWIPIFRDSRLERPEVIPRGR